MLDISPSKLDILITAGIVLLLLGMLYNNRRSPATSEGEAVDLGVEDLIEKVKTELINTDLKRIDSQQAPLFQIKDFDLEINFVVKASNKESGKVEFKVVTLGGEAEAASEKTQKIKLHMVVVPPRTQQAEASAAPPIGDDSIIIS